MEKESVIQSLLAGVMMVAATASIWFLLVLVAGI